MDSLSKAFTDSSYGSLISKNLKTKFIGKNIIFLPNTTSTSIIAKEKSEELENGTIIIANHQEKGKGRRGNIWFSPENKGLWFSIIIKNPSISKEYLPVINGLIALAIRDAVLTFGIKLQIKWPNDLLLEGKKVCGILSEIKISLKEVLLITGIGINTGAVEFPLEISNIATCLNLKKEKDREELFKTILKKIEKYYFLLSEKGSEEIIKKWQYHSITLTTEMYIKDKEGKHIPCKGVKFGSYGELIVKDINGLTRSIYNGEDIIQKIMLGSL